MTSPAHPASGSSVSSRFAQFAFFLLVMPYGASFGLVSVAFPVIARSRGLSVEQVGAVVAAAFIPHGIKFLWAPVVDATLSARSWYLIALALVVGGTVATAAAPVSPESLDLLTAVVVASQVGLTLLKMASEILIAEVVAPADKAKVAGAYEAGSYVGMGVGGGAALALAERLPEPWMVGASLGAVMMLCGLPLLGLPAVPAAGELKAAFGRLVDAVRTLLGTRDGRLGLAVALSPVGAGAANGYLGALADAWGASSDQVALVNGALGGVVGGFGCFVGGQLAGRIGAQRLYILGGTTTAVMGLLFVAAPHTADMWTAFSLAMGLTLGMTAAGFSGFVLEACGHGAVASTFNAFASLANLAVAYMTRIDGALHGWGGPWALFGGDTALVLLGAGLLLLLARPRAAKI